ncbi:hypothetical protein BO94DRAFT_567044 [Aspergillus sclerotioniger CBS 115572]|uniref:DNA replication regulator Sld3 C-terminal domain-containing protein n=1 Tax=Aspergillus sclerotioniger CBS 115572 TaxID=1450535 RepID=A0A317WBD0_9EURO|nr:hypothetical protein BO94DRAFT_567044 [Aspergillus sclerotioniger CBS 115572]PWY83121.1 hypothetical protein BO94DRAFT_567044 [Aspergillus sclerotioniger CBS 115572]
MATRGSLTTATALTPIPLNLVPNHLSSTPHSHKKRKTSHSDNDVFSISTSTAPSKSSPAIAVSSPQTISVRAHSATLSDKPFLLSPITVLSRDNIPFAWIDYQDHHSQQQQLLPGWLFEGDIPVLENGVDVVLAVRVVGETGVWVVERVKRGVYALLKLRGVGEGDVVVAAKGGGCVLAERPREKRAGEWWEVARIEDPGDGRVALGKRGRGMDVEVVFGGLVEDRVQEVQEMARSSSSESPVLLGVGEQSAADAAGLDDTRVDGLQSPQELLDGLREQYLQALYVSKTSVAYFAKGPLARCRAAFQSGNESAKPVQLVEFYREAVLTAKRMDHKYRETLPSTIQDILLSVSDDEAAQPKRKRKDSKKKLGKNGLYPEEGDLIRKWWRDRALNDQGLPSEMSREAESKKHVADLRLRETQLQILLILETMALEVIVADEEKKHEGKGEGTEKPTKSAKGKKPQDLNVMLELNLDRLCIWHAVSFEETVVSDSAKAYGSNHLSGKKVESDAVRDFCTEVIVPFYASRLPDKCKLITRKLGVSTAISPFTKQPQAKKAPQEPGTPVERQHAQKQSRRRAFQRVLTDQASSQTRHPPSLSRSNTTPAATDAKRDSLDPLLPTVSANVRGGIQKAKRVENREVDLNAVARQHESKLMKMQMLVEQKKELDAAIHALRKPNRELVAKDIAEDATKRQTTSGSSRKPKNPVRNPLGQGVQVAATPKGSRKKETIAMPLPKSLSQPSISKGSPSSPFTSEPQIVPGSNIRPGSISGLFRSADLGAIQETPTRRPSQPLSGGIGASPSISRPLFRVPSKPAAAAASASGPIPRAMEMGPSTPIAARHVDAYMPRVKSIGQSRPSMIMDTPPKQGMAPIPIPVPVPVITENTVPEPIGSGAVTETPVKATTTAAATTTTTTTPATVFATPLKSSAARLAVPTTTSAMVPVTPEKSIYAQLGWDDDDDFA